MKYQNLGMPDSYKLYAVVRDAAGLKDSDVARGAKIRRATISEWKAGLYTPKVDKLVRIAEVLNTTLDRLIT